MLKADENDFPQGGRRAYIPLAGFLPDFED